MPYFDISHEGEDESQGTRDDDSEFREDSCDEDGDDGGGDSENIRAIR